MVYYRYHNRSLVIDTCYISIMNNTLFIIKTLMVTRTVVHILYNMLLFCANNTLYNNSEDLLQSIHIIFT